MKLKDFIQNQVLLPRLKKNGVLVVYDPDVRYRDLCLEMGTETLRVIDASESSILTRENALRVFNELGATGTKLEGMLVYVPTGAPVNDEEKQHDPFALYTVCGNVFPDGDGDEYMNICLRARPDHGTAIRRIFAEDPNPGFQVIDAVGSGKGWPNLQVLLGVESAVDILFALLNPSAAQKDDLKGQESWVSEAKELFLSSMGLKLVSRGKTWPPIADELWRFLLFSEFVFDLPEVLPDSLANVPKARPEARPLVEALCDRLRNDRRAQPIYIDRAESIERDIELPRHCRSIRDLGVRDTFPFEERTFIGKAMDAIRQDDRDTARSILGRHRHSVWIGKGESQAQWGLMEAALALCEACDDNERQLPNNARDLNALIDFYIDSLREVDRLHREFEQAVADLLEADAAVTEIIEKGRNDYRRLAAKVHDLFVRHVEKTGWPPLGRPSNGDVFDGWVAPRLQETGHRVAVILVDALRYELGVVLKRELGEDDSVDLTPAYALLPTTTRVGMAGLLPEAGKTLRLLEQNGDIIPALGEMRLSNVNQRMDVLRQRFGQRFFEMTLNTFIRMRKPLPDTVDLLILRSAEIDSQMETAAETALRLIHDTLKRIRVAVHKLKALGFQEVVIATDHGFFLNTHAEAGDVCAKPAGAWTFIHDRFALGNGVGDDANFVLSAEHLGIRGSFDQAAGPWGLVPYRAGQLYFHGGISLQECIVPVLAIRLGHKPPEQQKVNVVLSYKGGAKRITTRLPVIDMQTEMDQMQLFPQGLDMELLLEAHDRKGNLVGEAKAGGVVNPATGTITIKPGERMQVTLKMLLDFEGKFTVKALNPATLATYCKLELETDYVV